VTTKLRVDPNLLDGHDLIAIEETTGKPFNEALTTAAGLYAMAWRARLRAGDTDATYENTLSMPLVSFDVDVNDKGEAPGDGNGIGPLSSPETGPSIPVTS